MALSFTSALFGRGEDLAAGGVPNIKTGLAVLHLFSVVDKPIDKIEGFGAIAWIESAHGSGIAPGNAFDEVVVRDEDLAAGA